MPADMPSTSSLATRRSFWVGELAKISEKFGEDSAKMARELRLEIERDGHSAVLDHLRLCGAMPEQYRHDSSEEKLYSKYTDSVISEAIAAIGLKSMVLSGRADCADVQAKGRDFSLVADAKSFRLSRTAKNQKDFKIQAMDGWRNGLDYAVVVAPIYQMPRSASQIYQQAIARNVCILSYSHLAALVGLAGLRGCAAAKKGLHAVLKRVKLMSPGKNADDYWSGVNQCLVGAMSKDDGLWAAEKRMSLLALDLAKIESLRYLTFERDRLLGLSHRDALAELVRLAGVDSRISRINGILHGELLGD